MAATSEIEKLERRHGENPDGRFFAPLADAYRKAGQLDRALEVVRKGLEKHPEYLSAHIVLGRCLLAVKDDEGAGQAFQRVLGLDSENIIALKSLAEIAERKGEPADACAWLQQLLKIDPMNADAEADLKRLGGAAASAPTQPMEAVAVEEAPTAEVSFADVAASQAPMPAAAPEVVAAAAPEEPAMLVAPALEGIETTEFTPPAEEIPPPEVEIKPFDDTLAWGTGERSSRSISSDDVERALHEHEASLAEPSTTFEPVEGPAEHVALEPLPVEEAWSSGAADPWSGGQQSESAAGAALPPAAEPAEMSGWDVAISSQDEAAMFAAPEYAAPGPPRREAAGGPSLADLPIIMPEDVTPPEEMGRAAARAAAPAAPDTTAVPPAGGGALTEEPAAAAPSEAETPPLLTETMGDLYLRQGFGSEAAEVYRRLLQQRPGDAGLLAKLASIEGPPPSLGAAALGTESARSWLRRVAQSRVGVSALPQPPAPPAGPTPLEEAFGGPDSPPEPVGEPTRPAEDAFTLDAIFGSQGAAPAAPAAAEAPPPPPPTGTSFDEFFGAPPEQGSVRPEKGDEPASPPDDDIGSFNSWLQGLKR